MKKYKTCTAELGYFCSKHQCTHKSNTPLCDMTLGDIFEITEQEDARGAEMTIKDVFDLLKKWAKAVCAKIDKDSTYKTDVGHPIKIPTIANYEVKKILTKMFELPKKKEGKL